MSGSDTSIRLCVEQPLGVAQQVVLGRDQSHYLVNVMRRVQGDRLALFNCRDGEWRAEITAADKRGTTLRCLDQTRPQDMPPDLWLLFAPVKKARTDFIVEKAAELGARRIVPVQTDHTNAERIRRDRLQAHAVEAAEQCGGLFVPEVADPVPLQRLLDSWDPARQVMFCDEQLAGATRRPLPDRGGEPWAVLIGPEGGFSDAERRRLVALDFCHPVSLGPRILRADTAAVAALTLWQSRLGDWA